MTVKIYTVESGESLTKIAEKLYGEQERWKEIAFLNSLAHPYVIYPGQLLQVPDNDEPPLTINVVGKRAPTATAPVTTKAPNFSFSPATVKVLAVGAVLYLLLK